MFVRPLGVETLKILHQKILKGRAPRRVKGASDEEHSARLAAALVCSHKPHVLLDALDKATLMALMRELYRSREAYDASSRASAGLDDSAVVLHIRCKILLLWDKDAVRTVMFSQMQMCACHWSLCSLWLRNH